MNRCRDEVLQQEVHELTELLQDDPDWRDLRDALAGKGLAATSVLLAGFQEDEVGNEFGAVVDPEGAVFEYQRSSAASSKGFLKWERIAEPKDLLDNFPAVEVALRMLSETGDKGV